MTTNRAYERRFGIIDRAASVLSSKQRAIRTPGTAGSRRRVLSGRPRFGWIPAAWVAVSYASGIKLSGGRSARAALEGSLSRDNLFELAVYAAVGWAVLVAWTKLRKRVFVKMSTGMKLLLLYAIVALLSSLWSIVPIFTLARAIQVLIVALLAHVSVMVWTSGIRSRSADWNRIWLGFLGILVILTVFRFNYGGAGRSQFEHVHPIVTAIYFGAAMVVLAAASLDRTWPMKRVVRSAAVGGAFVATFLMLSTITRGIAVASFFGVAVVLATARTRQGRRRFFLFAGALYGAGLAVAIYWDHVRQFALRGGSAEQLATLNGRTQLLDLTLELVAGRELQGLGFMAGRAAYLEVYPWAGGGHNYFVDVFLNLGLVGLLVGIALMSWLVWTAIGEHRSIRNPVVNLAVGLTAFVIVTGSAFEGASSPGFSLTLLALLAAVLSYRRVGDVDVTRVAHRGAWPAARMVMTTPGAGPAIGSRRGSGPSRYSAARGRPVWARLDR